MGGCPPAFSSHHFPCVLGAVVTPPHTHTPSSPHCILGLSICSTSVQRAHVPAHNRAPKCRDPPREGSHRMGGSGAQPSIRL